MVRIFLSGIGGSGKTTLVNDLLQEEYFRDFETITEIARDIMKRKKITSEMISSNLKFHMMLQDEIVKEQTRQGGEIFSVSCIFNENIYYQRRNWRTPTTSLTAASWTASPSSR